MYSPEQSRELSAIKAKLPLAIGSGVITLKESRDFVDDITAPNQTYSSLSKQTVKLIDKLTKWNSKA